MNYWKVSWALRIVIAFLMTFLGAFVVSYRFPTVAILLVFGGIVFQVFNFLQMNRSIKKREAKLQERINKLDGLK